MAKSVSVKARARAVRFGNRTRKMRGVKRTERLSFRGESRTAGERIRGGSSRFRSARDRTKETESGARIIRGRKRGGSLPPGI